MLCRPAEARRLRSVRACRPRGRPRRRLQRRRCLRRHFRRDVRRHLLRRAAQPHRRCSAARICATNSNWIWSRRCSAPRPRFKIPSLTECKTCKGTGAAKGSTPKTCDTCHGQGQVRVQQSIFTIQQPCPRCKGRGKIICNPCDTCYGQGRVRQEKTLAGAGAGGRRHRRSHPLERRGRGGPQRRPGRRSVRRDSRARTCHFRARRQPSVLRGADQLHHRRTRRHGRGADARRRGGAQDPGRDPVGPRVSRAREGRAPGARRRAPAICSAASWSRRR